MVSVDSDESATPETEPCRYDNTSSLSTQANVDTPRPPCSENHRMTRSMKAHRLSTHTESGLIQGHEYNSSTSSPTIQSPPDIRHARPYFDHITPAKVATAHERTTGTEKQPTRSGSNYLWHGDPGNGLQEAAVVENSSSDSVGSTGKRTQYLHATPTVTFTPRAEKGNLFPASTEETPSKKRKGQRSLHFPTNEANGQSDAAANDELQISTTPNDNHHNLPVPSKSAFMCFSEAHNKDSKVSTCFSNSLQMIFARQRFHKKRPNITDFSRPTLNYKRMALLHQLLVNGNLFPLNSASTGWKWLSKTRSDTREKEKPTTETRTRVKSEQKNTHWHQKDQ